MTQPAMTHEAIGVGERRPGGGGFTLGALTLSLMEVANKTRKAKGTTDLIVHANVIVSLAALLVAVAKARRDYEGH